VNNETFEVVVNRDGRRSSVLNIILAIDLNVAPFHNVLPRMEPCEVRVLERQWIIDSHQLHEHVRNDVS
jgi:hypothetical protein